MSLAAIPGRLQAVDLLRRALARGRLAHAYLFVGSSPDLLAQVARNLAKTLNCLHAPVASENAGDREPDSCDRCSACTRIDGGAHPDIQWVRPESKSRVITIDQIRDLLQVVQLKPAEARYKVAILVDADRLNVQAANAFLKTLEEPPARSVLILLSGEPQRLLDTIQSRCLRLSFHGGSLSEFGPEARTWLGLFARTAGQAHPGVLGRYRLLGLTLARLAELRKAVEARVASASPLAAYSDVDPHLREKWEDELEAAVEAEYRRQRGEVLRQIQWWCRDLWLQKAGPLRDLQALPELEAHTSAVATRVTADQAQQNLRVLEETQRLLNSNVQEALALEVGWLKLRL